MENYKRSFSPIQMEILESAVRQIIEVIDPDPSRAGLEETPHRVAKMYEEVFQGSRYTNDEIAEMFDKL